MLEIILFIFLFIIFILLSLKLRIEILDFESINFKNKFNIKIKLYILKIKVFQMTLNEDKLNVFKIDSKKAIKILSIDNYKLLNPKIKSLDLKLKLGLVENMITTFGVTAVSSVLSIFLSKHINIINKDKFKYNVKPIFDEFYLGINLKMKLEVNSFSIYKFIILNRELIKLPHKNIPKLEESSI